MWSSKSNDGHGASSGATPLSEIAHALIRAGAISREVAVQAEQRRRLYGGGLDTALFELKAADEETLLGQLAEIIGIPLPPAEVIRKAPAKLAAQWMDAATAQRLGAAPRSRQGDVLDVLVRPEHDHDGLVAWAAERSILVEPGLVSEARFRALLCGLYDIAIPARYLSLLARLAGPAYVREAAGTSALRDMRTPTPVVAGIDPVETLLGVARLGDDSARRTALRRLSRRLQDRRVVAYRHSLEAKAAQSDARVSAGALAALSELRDKNAVPVIAELLDSPNKDIATAAHGALVSLTCEDLGPKSKRWMDWWAEMGQLSRIEWLLEGLAHRTPELRLLASNELYEISGEYFGYHYDLPERDREEARQRWIAWWQAKDKGR